MSVRNVVLVHGAFADGSSWSKVMVSHATEVARVIDGAARALAS